jgi:hypothetical protein
MLHYLLKQNRRTFEALRTVGSREYIHSAMIISVHVIPQELQARKFLLEDVINLNLSDLNKIKQIRRPLISLLLYTRVSLAIPRVTVELLSGRARVREIRTKYFNFVFIRKRFDTRPEPMFCQHTVLQANVERTTIHGSNIYQ